MRYACKHKGGGKPLPQIAKGFATPIPLQPPQSLVPGAGLCDCDPSAGSTPWPHHSHSDCPLRQIRAKQIRWANTTQEYSSLYRWSGASSMLEDRAEKCRGHRENEKIRILFRSCRCFFFCHLALFSALCKGTGHLYRCDVQQFGRECRHQWSEAHRSQWRHYPDSRRFLYLDELNHGPA